MAETNKNPPNPATDKPVSLKALGLIRLDGKDVPEGETFEASRKTADDLVKAGVAQYNAKAK